MFHGKTLQGGAKAGYYCKSCLAEGHTLREDVQQRTLTRPRCSHDGHHLLGLDVEGRGVDERLRLLLLQGSVSERDTVEGREGHRQREGTVGEQVATR